MSDRDCLDLAQTLCTRLCHDLAGPFGAVSSGAELLREDGAQADAEVISLLAGSAASASVRLRLMRAAMGTPTGRDLDPDGTHALLAQYLTASGGRRAPTLDWIITPKGQPSPSDRPLTQVILNLCLVLLDAVPRAERLSVDAQTLRATTMRASGPGPIRTEPLDALRAALDGAPPPTDPRNVQGAFAGLLARASDLTVALDSEPGSVRLSLHPRPCLDTESD